MNNTEYFVAELKSYLFKHLGTGTLIATICNYIDRIESSYKKQLSAAKQVQVLSGTVEEFTANKVTELTEVLKRERAKYDDLNKKYFGLVSRFDGLADRYSELLKAVRWIYYACYWIPDRDLCGKEANMWARLRDAARFEKGKSPKPSVEGLRISDLTKQVASLQRALEERAKAEAEDISQLKVDLERERSRTAHL